MSTKIEASERVEVRAAIERMAKRHIDAGVPPHIAYQTARNAARRVESGILRRRRR